MLTIFIDFKAPNPFVAVSQLPAALQLPRGKKLSLDFWSMHLVNFVIFIDLSPHPQAFAAVSQLPVALRLPEKKKHAVGLFENMATPKQAIMPQIPKIHHETTNHATSVESWDPWWSDIMPHRSIIPR